MATFGGTGKEEENLTVDGVEERRAREEVWRERENILDVMVIGEDRIGSSTSTQDLLKSTSILFNSSNLISFSVRSKVRKSSREAKKIWTKKDSRWKM